MLLWMKWEEHTNIDIDMGENEYEKNTDKRKIEKGKIQHDS